MKILDKFQPIYPTILLFLTIICHYSFSIVSNGFSIFPLLIIMVIFYWSLYWPSWMPSVLVVIAGLLYDILIGQTIGVNALLLLSLHVITLWQRRFAVKQPFLIIWGIFAVIATLYVISDWLIISAIYQKFIFHTAIIWKLLLTILFYPVVHKLCNILHPEE